MSSPVSLHPYFKIHPGQEAAAEALLPRFVAKTEPEAGMLYYEFTRREDVVFCREAYRDAAAALAHLESVGELLGEILKVSALHRLEVHGPAAELAKMHGPMASLPVQWFTVQAGVAR